VARLDNRDGDDGCRDSNDDRVKAPATGAPVSELVARGGGFTMNSFRSTSEAVLLGGFAYSDRLQVADHSEIQDKERNESRCRVGPSDDGGKISSGNGLSKDRTVYSV
jgi:hypothetical protein